MAKAQGHDTWLLSQLSLPEKRKLARLQREDKKLGETMLKTQREYSIAARQGILSKTRLDALADKGFKYERLAFASRDALNRYLEQLVRKYK